MDLKEVLTRDITLEKPKKWLKGLVVPIILFLVIAIYWGMIIQLNIIDYNNERYGKPYITDAFEVRDITYVELPYKTAKDIIHLRYEINPKIVENGKATVYYLEKTRTWHFPKPKGAWIIWYVLGGIMTVLDLCWIAVVLYDKKQVAIRKKSSEGN